MKFTLNSLSYDFGQRRASAGIQTSNLPGSQMVFLNVNFAADAPAHISADELNSYLVDEVRRQLLEASKFDLAAGLQK